MVSVELLRRYKFFLRFNENQLKGIALISNLQSFGKGSLVVKENSDATHLFLLISGDINLVYSGAGEDSGGNVLVGSLAPGDVFGVSSLIEPYQFISSVKNVSDVEVISIDAYALRALAELDPHLGYTLMRQISACVLERLKFTQMELAQARV